MEASDIYWWWRLFNIPLASLMAIVIFIKVGRIWSTSTIDVKLACIGMGAYGVVSSAVSLSRIIFNYPADWGSAANTLPLLLMLCSGLISPRRGSTYG